MAECAHLVAMAKRAEAAELRATELLEALERVEQALSAYQVECGPLMTPDIDAEEVTTAARVAIKKARGG